MPKVVILPEVGPRGGMHHGNRQGGNVRRIGAVGHVATDDEFEFMLRTGAFDEDAVAGAEDVLIVERIKEMLLG